MARLDGIINFNKPVGVTSAKALYGVRSLTRQRKSGHAGTLDPGASGVLVICLGKATRLVESIMDQPKVYRATARLDVTSESFDIDRPLIPVEAVNVPTLEAVRTACASFEGLIEQVPPQISAIKVGGVPAYRRAARNKPVALKPRPVRVYWLHLHAYLWPQVDLEVCCGRGTYVRSLIRDLGKRLGTGGCLTSLVRRRVGPFTESEAWTLEALKAAAPGGMASRGVAAGSHKQPHELRRDSDHGLVGGSNHGLVRDSHLAPAYLIDLDSARRLLDPAAMEIPDRPAGNTPESPIVA